MSKKGMLPEEMQGVVGQELPDVMLTYQTRLMASSALTEVLFVEKSRRIGATWGIGADAVLTSALARNEGGMDTFYMGYNLEMAREFIDVCGSWAKAFNQACSDVDEVIFEDVDENGHTKEIKAFRIRFASGFEIVALPSSPRSLRGKQGFIIIDEAAFHDDLEELLKAAYAMLIWGGRIIVISTHDGVDNVFNQQIQAIKEKRKGFQRHNVIKITFKDAINEGLYERICLVTGKEPTAEDKEDFVQKIYDFYGDGASEELDVIPKKSGGTYLAAQMVEPCMQDVPVVELALKDDFFSKPDFIKKQEIREWCEENLKPLLDLLDPSLVHYFGFDFARHCDLSIFAPIYLEKNTRRNIPFAVELRNVPFSQQEQILDYLISNLPRFAGGFMDATGNGASIAEKMQEKFGAYRIHAIKISVKWYEEALPPYKAAFEDAFIRIPRTADILQDHRTVQVINGVPQIPNLKGNDGERRHGDSLVAFAGAYWATNQETNEYGYETAAARNVAQSFMKPNNFVADIKFNSRFEKGCF